MFKMKYLTESYESNADRRLYWFEKASMKSMWRWNSDNFLRNYNYICATQR